MFLVSAAEIRKLDCIVQDRGVPALILMENAGRALADHSSRLLQKLGVKSPKEIVEPVLEGWPRQGERQEAWPSIGAAGQAIVILAGPGQNGGDGFCAARHLSSMGYSVKVAFFGDVERLPHEARLNHDMIHSYPVPVYQVSSSNLQEVIAQLGSPDLIIDALLGTGAEGNPRPPMDLAVDWVNSQGVPVVACDIPTGVSANTGYVHKPCVQADLTVTFGFAKIGLFSYPGRMFAGEIIVENLGFPADLVKGPDIEDDGPTCYGGKGKKIGGDGKGEPVPVLARAMCLEDARKLLPKRRADHHKGLSGHVTVIAGSLGMAGAAVLSAKSALRSGAGTVTLLCPGSVWHVCVSMAPEVMVVPCGDSDTFASSPETLNTVEFYTQKAGALVIGPGWGRGCVQTEFLKEILPLASKKTCVVDADALFALKQLGGLSYLAGSQGRFILTPHLGEMARLIGLSIDDLEKDRPGNARKASTESNSIVCLKGAGTCIASPLGQLFVNTSGASCMATAGSGDVLTGTIAALAAQGLSPLDSARVGVFWHGLAGEAVCSSKGSVGVLAGDIIECLPAARRLIEQELGSGRFCEKR